MSITGLGVNLSMAEPSSPPLPDAGDWIPFLSDIVCLHCLDTDEQ